MKPDIVEESWGQKFLRVDDCESTEARLIGLDGESTLGLERLAGTFELDFVE